MADPLSIAASVLAVSTAAIQSVKALYETVNRYKGRDKTLRRLHDELADLMTILESLTKALSTEESLLMLLQGPVGRCSQVCREFESSMKAFEGKSTTGFRDWTRMEFMRGSINEFIETIAGYKATISVGLGAVTMNTSKVTQHVIEEYNEMIKDTAYNLDLQLQRIDAKLTQLTPDQNAAPRIRVDLDDEREVTRQCLQVCEKATSYIQDLSHGASTLFHKASHEAAPDGWYEAQIQTSRTLSEARESFARTSLHLARRLELLVDGNTVSDDERTRLRYDIEASKQCLDICNFAGEMSRQKIYRVGEVIAEGNSDQVVVNTLADLFDVGKAMSTDHSTALVGSMTSEDFRYVADKRYNSRFGAPPTRATPTEASQSSPHSDSGPQSNKHSPEAGDQGRPLVRPRRQEKPSSNENRRRVPGGETSEAKEI